MSCLSHLIHGAIEGEFVRFGGPGETAQLSDELERGGTDFFIRGRRFEVMQGFNAPTHKRPHSLNRKSLSAAWDAPDGRMVIGITKRPCQAVAGKTDEVHVGRE
jgi:hypothetical protein